MTTFVSAANFLPLVMPWVPGAPQMAIRAEVVRSAVRFCEMSGVWAENCDPINVVAATSTYAITQPVGVTNAQPVVIKQAKYNNAKLYKVTVEELYDATATWQENTGTPQKFLQLNPTSITLYPTPEAVDALVDGLELLVAYKPTMTATTVPDFLFNQYGFGVAAGAIASLLSMPGKTWTNPQLAAYYAKIASGAINDARIDAEKAFCAATTRIMTRFV